MKFLPSRREMPQAILVLLPFLLFFPVGIVYLGVVLFLLALVFAGDYRTKWLTVRQHPLFWPIMALSAVSCLAALFLERSASKFWSSFGHYQTYLFLLLFISVGKGDWQARARKVFFAGAVYAATLFYLDLLGLLPSFQPFTNYAEYDGNKSILLGVLLGLAAGLMFYELTITTDRRRFWWRLLTFLYVAAAVLFLTRTRTGILLFLLLCLLASLQYISLSWRSLGWLLGIAALLGLAWGVGSDFRTRTMGTINDVKAYSEGHKVSSQGNRLEIFALTSQIIAENPLRGHGIGMWEARYGKLAKERSMQAFATPHNDYLLYAAEMGVFGLAALLWIWLTQLVVGWKMDGDDGMRLIMLGLAIMVGGMFNAVLRDAVFGMAFMVLLAIPLAGARREKSRQPEPIPAPDPTS